MSMHDLLLQLSQISSALYQQASPPDDSTSGLGLDIPDFLLPFPRLTLDVPSPGYLSPALIDAGAPEPLAHELSEIHSRSSNELAEQYLQVYRTSCVDIATRAGKDENSRAKLYQHLQETSRRHFRQEIEAWERDTIHAIRSRPNSDSNKKTATRRSALNSNVTCVLGAVFRETPYPSRAVRKELAYRYGITVKQIKTWFQNRRSRARKSGMDNEKRDFLQNQCITEVQNSGTPDLLVPPPTRLPDDSLTSHKNHPVPSSSISRFSPKEPDTTLLPSPPKTSSRCSTHIDKRNSLSSLEACQSSRLNSSGTLSDCETVVDSDSEVEVEENHKISLSRSSSITLIDNPVSSLSWQSPSYAFPTKYPPKLVEDPFPCRAYHNFSFPKPVWQRIPCSTPTPLIPANVSELAGQLSRLSLDVSGITNAPHEETTDSGHAPKASNRFIQPGNPIVTHTYTAPLPFMVCPNHQQSCQLNNAAELMAESHHACPEVHVPTAVGSCTANLDSPKCLLFSNIAGAAVDGTVTESLRQANDRAISLSTQGMPGKLGLNTHDVGRVFGLACLNPFFSWNFEGLLPSFSESVPIFG